MPAIKAASISQTQPIGLAERCDRCGARAKVRAVLYSGGELFFCGHHAREHEDRLRHDAVSLQSVSTGTDATRA